ncbi:MAG: type II secretion system protein [Bacillaceae bacterium]|nr:MAG: type II secretion system protein [Bacillaceae bacterium]
MVMRLKLMQMETSLRATRQSGFTVLEMLLVLSIFLLISSFIWIGATNIYREKVIDQFFVQLEKDLLYVQQHAFVNKEKIYLFWYPDKHYYEAERSGFKGELFERAYDQNIKVESGNIKFPIEYSPSGYFYQAGTIFISYDKKTYKIIFNLGRGRFRVEKL